MSVGKESRVPPPATELMAPARKADPKATAAWGKVNADIKLVSITDLNRTEQEICG
jgi:hypothetical protein